MDFNIFEYIEESVEFFDDFENVDESLLNPKSSHLQVHNVYNRAVQNIANIERKAMSLEKEGKYKESISMYKKAISETNKYIKEVEKLPDANKYDIGAATNPYNAGAMTAEIVLNKGKIKNASKNWAIRIFNNFVKSYTKKIEKLEYKL